MESRQRVSPKSIENNEMTADIIWNSRSRTTEIGQSSISTNRICVPIKLRYLMKSWNIKIIMKKIAARQRLNDYLAMVIYRNGNILLTAEFTKQRKVIDSKTGAQHVVLSLLKLRQQI